MVGAATEALAKAKRVRTSKADMEKRWFDIFSSWDRADRDAALKVLETLNRHLPANPRKGADDDAETS